MKLEDVKKVVVIGSGAMGNGIAQSFAVTGYDVVLVDIKQEFLNSAVGKIKKSLEIMTSKGKIDQSVMDAVLNQRLSTSTSNAEAVKGAQIVVEAVPEIMDLKKKVFKEVSDAAAPDTILATNTSTMSITEIATAVSNPERFVGLHYFFPANIMKLVEVIYGQKTSDNTIDVLMQIGAKTGKIPIKVLKDRPGFIVNRINSAVQAFQNAFLDEGSIKPADFDAMMKSIGVKMAPFETADFSGLDVFCHGMDYYAKTLGPEYKPGKYLQDKLAKNELGFKTGQGIYKWENGKAVIDTSNPTKELTPVHLISIQINEAVRIIKEGIAESAKDVDTGMKAGMGAPAGPFEMTAGMEASQITEALNFLNERYKLNVFKPEPEIIDGSFKSMK